MLTSVETLPDRLFDLKNRMGPVAFQRMMDAAQREALLREKEQQATGTPEQWDTWLQTMFPETFNKPFAKRHVEFWNHIEGIRKGEKPRSFFAIWCRGGAKTTSAEAAVVRLGAKRERNFCLYVRGTQQKANESVGNIASMLEGATLGKHYPALTERKESKYGHSKGWTMSMLRTASGYNVLALGLDAAVRGVKLENYRPDVIILDDIDDKQDTKKTIEKKIDRITTDILPAGSSDVAIIGIQNLIHTSSIFSMISDGSAEFLYDREVSGPYPAVDGLTYTVRPEGGYTITGGTATWAGQPIELCETQINEWGLTSFLQEAQHDVEAPPGGIWDHVVFRHIDYDDVPDLVRGCVWVDPAITSTDRSDSHAIQADAIGDDDKVYRFYSWEQVTSPEDSIRRAIMIALRYKFETVGVETDQGGDAWKSVFRVAVQTIFKSAKMIVARRKMRETLDGDDVEEKDRVDIEKEMSRIDVELMKEDYAKVLGPVSVLAKDIADGTIKMPTFKQAKAGAGHGSKVHRNSLMLTDYETGNVIHVRGTHDALEKGLRRFPLTKPFDLVDAAYWGWNDLKGTSTGVFF